MIILEENFKWHLEAFASELFIFTTVQTFKVNTSIRRNTLYLSNVNKCCSFEPSSCDL